MKVRLTPQAGEDIEAIAAYLVERNQQGAQNVLASIYASISSIGRQPYAAAETDDGTLRVKVLTKYSYKIFYDIRHSAIEIVHICHDSREPWKKS